MAIPLKYPINIFILFFKNFFADDPFWIIFL